MEPTPTPDTLATPALLWPERTNRRHRLHRAAAVVAR